MFAAAWENAEDQQHGTVIFPTWRGGHQEKGPDEHASILPRRRALVYYDIYRFMSQEGPGNPVTKQEFRRHFPTLPGEISRRSTWKKARMPSRGGENGAQLHRQQCRLQSNGGIIEQQ